MNKLWTILCLLYHVGECAVQAADHWQTLLAGFLALVGAWWTVRKIRDQINQAANFEKDRLAREERAARIVLPMALGGIQQYAVDCIKLLLPFAPVVGESSEVTAGMTAPRIPDGTLEPTQTCAKFADGQISEEISALVRWLQVQHARLDSLIERAASRQTKTIAKVEAIGAIMDAAEVHARCGGLFPYSRGVAPDPALTFQVQLQTALFIAGIVAVDHPDLAAAIKGRQPHSFE